MAKQFKDFTGREILALAISLEEEDERVYGDFADGLREHYPATAKVFEQMMAEESGHRARLIDLFRAKFGEHIPLIRRQDVSGFLSRKPVWLFRPLAIHVVRKQAEIMELETRRFYERAMQQTADASIRKLLGDLAVEEVKHLRESQRARGGARRRPAGASEEVAQRRLFLLQVVQPGLAGLMDGSVSTLAPVRRPPPPSRTKSSRDAFLVGLAASVARGFHGFRRSPLGRRLTDAAAPGFAARSAG